MDYVQYATRKIYIKVHAFFLEFELYSGSSDIVCHRAQHDELLSLPLILKDYVTSSSFISFYGVINDNLHLNPC